jgi:hypothetical protein
VRLQAHATSTPVARDRSGRERGKLRTEMNSEWAIHYFDPELGREMESPHLSSLEEAVSLAQTYERRGSVVRFLASPHGKMNWPLSKRRAP